MELMKGWRMEMAMAMAMVTVTAVGRTAPRRQKQGHT